MARICDGGATPVGGRAAATAASVPVGAAGRGLESAWAASSTPAPRLVAPFQTGGFVTPAVTQWTNIDCTVVPAAAALALSAARPPCFATQSAATPEVSEVASVVPCAALVRSSGSVALFLAAPQTFSPGAAMVTSGPRPVFAQGVRSRVSAATAVQSPFAA